MNRQLKDLRPGFYWLVQQGESISMCEIYAYLTATSYCVRILGSEEGWTLERFYTDLEGIGDLFGPLLIPVSVYRANKQFNEPKIEEDPHHG